MRPTTPACGDHPGPEASSEQSWTQLGRRDYLAMLALAAAVLAARAFFVDLPLERDEGEYAYIGWRLGFGEIPYLHWVDQKPPGVFGVYALALCLPGDPVAAIRVVAALFCAASAAAFFGLARSFVGRGAAVLAALALALLSLDPTLQGPIANSELFMLTPLLAAHLVFLRAARVERPPRPDLLALGFCLGVACAFKQVAAVNALFFLVAWPWLRGSFGRDRALRPFVVWSSVGGGLAWLPIVLWFQLRGGLWAMWDAAFLHNFAYAGALDAATRFEALALRLSDIAASQGLPWLIAAAGLACGCAAPRYRRATLYASGWTLSSFVGVSASGYYFPHYFQQLLPPLALLIAIATQWVLDGHRWRAGSPAVRAALVGGILLLQPAVATTRAAWLGPDRLIQEMYPATAFERMRDVGTALAEVTAAGESVFVFGSEPQLLFYAKRASATRYIHLFPLYGRYDDALAEQRRTIDELEAAQPAAIVWVPNRLFFVPEVPHALTRWVIETLDRDYIPYAVVEKSSESRGRVRRLRAEEQSHEVRKLGWAVIYRRQEAGP